MPFAIFASKAVCAGGKAAALSANGCRILFRYLWMKAIIVSSPIPRSWDISAWTEPGSQKAVRGVGHPQRGRCTVLRRHDVELEEQKNVQVLYTGHRSTCAEQVQEDFIVFFCITSIATEMTLSFILVLSDNCCPQSIRAMQTSISKRESFKVCS